MKELYLPVSFVFALIVTGCGGSGGESSPASSTQTQLSSRSSSSPSSVAVSSESSVSLSSELASSVSSVHISSSTSSVSSSVEASSTSSSVSLSSSSSVSSLSVSSSSSLSSSTSSAISVAPPSNINAVAGDEQIAVSWQASPQASHYSVYYAQESFAALTHVANYASLEGGSLIDNVTSTNRTLLNLDNNQPVFIVVTAWRNGVQSAKSAEASATPTAPVNNNETLACVLKVDGGQCDEFIALQLSGRSYELRNTNAAGKTYCMVPAATAKGMTLENVFGAANNPVTITNCGGKVTLDTDTWQRGITVLNSRYLRITGTGSADDFYGIHIKDSEGASVDATDGTSDIEIDHVHIENSGGSGILVRTYPFTSSCHLEWTRPNFTQYNTKVHNNYINGTRWEGLYIGTSHYELADGPTGTNCGAQSAPQASLVGVKIYNNRIENIGNDAIQLGAAIADVAVYQNTIRNYAMNNNGQHAGGLQLNAGTVGAFYNNYVQAHPATTKAQGLMYIGGEGPVYVYNNIFVRGEKAIMTLNRMPNNTQFFYTNNTFYGQGTDDTFYFFCNVLPDVQAYTIKRNIFSEYGTIGANATGGWNYFNGSQGAKCPMNGLVMPGYAPNESDMHMTENYFSRSGAAVQFVNPAAGNFVLQPTSPALGMGADLNIVRPLPTN